MADGRIETLHQARARHQAGARHRDREFCREQVRGLGIVRQIHTVLCVRLHGVRLQIRDGLDRAPRSVQRRHVGREPSAGHTAGELGRSCVEPLKCQFGRFAQVGPMESSSAVAIRFPILPSRPAALLVGREAAVLANKREGCSARQPGIPGRRAYQNRVTCPPGLHQTSVSHQWRCARACHDELLRVGDLWGTAKVYYIPMWGRAQGA